MTSSIPENPEGLYRHYKGGVYRVIGLARHSETHEPLIVYVSDDEARLMWVRPAAMFFEVIRRPDGKDHPRFERIG